MDGRTFLIATSLALQPGLAAAQAVADRSTTSLSQIRQGIIDELGYADADLELAQRTSVFWVRISAPTSHIAALREQPWVDAYWVYPDVAAGVVTLYGYARSETMRQALMVLARAVPGVTAVRDQMDPMPLFVRAAF